MEKKSTKIAYFVALGIFIVLLVVLGISYKDAPILIEGATTPFAGTFWSLLPPIVAIVLALISKEVYSSLFLGCLVGALLVSNFAPWETLVQLVEGDNGIVTTVSDAGNIAIIVFLVVLGIMVDLMNKTGGSEAFGRWATKTVHTRAGAQLMTMLLGVLIFIDDYFNCLTVGAVMRPVTESHHISRAKLAYVIDSTAAPVCMIAPVSSWAAAVSGYVNSDNVSGIEMFIKQIPWNYYCLLTLLMIVVISLLNIDYGPMLTHEYNAQVKDDLFTTPERPFAGADDYETGSKGKSSVLDLILPVVVLIVTCIVGLIYTGGFFDAESEYVGDFMGAFSNASSGAGLAIGSMLALVFTFIYFWLRGSIGFEKSFESVPNGFIQMISPILILTFAWTLCGLTRYGMNSADFVVNAMSGAGDLAKFLPAVIFIIARPSALPPVPPGAPSVSWLPSLSRCSTMTRSPSCAPSAGSCLRRRRYGRSLLPHLRYHHHGFRWCPLLPPEPCVHPDPLRPDRGRRFLRQLYPGRSAPERGHLPRHCLRADGSDPAGHPRHYGQEASGYLPGDGRSQQGSGQQVSGFLLRQANKKGCTRFACASFFLRLRNGYPRTC